MRALNCLLACALALSFPPAVQAADAGLDPAAIATAERLREQALAGNLAWDFVSALTTEIGPRLAGTEADARAVAWTRARFEAMGFDRVYLEPVTFPVWLRGRESAEVLVPFPQPLVITTIGGSIGTGGPLEAEVAVFPTLEALETAPEGSLAGKIAFISHRMPRFRDGHGYGTAVAARSRGAVAAARKGAVALLIRSIGTSDDRFAHTGNMRYAAGVPRIPAAALSNPDADQLLRMLQAGHVPRLRLDIEARMPGEYTSYNVIAEITGRELPQDVVSIGGHLDSWDLGTGAIDDGAGVAITAAAGALIASLEQRPRRSIRVIAYANEEQGLYGGKAYAAAREAEGAIALHQLGAESDFGAGRIYALRAGVDAAAWPAIERIGEVLAPLGIALEREGGGPGPDLLPMAAKGAPWAELAQDGSDYFDYHHTANDTLDKIEPAALDQQVAAYAVLAWLAAETTLDFGRSPPGKAK